MSLQPGIYEALLHEKLDAVLKRHPELRSVFGKLDPEEEPARLASFVSKVLEQALRLETNSASRLNLCNQLVQLMSSSGERSFLVEQKLVSADKTVLLEITPPNYGVANLPRPETSLVESSLFTGAPGDPQLVHELQREMRSADSVDVLVSFIKWGGVQLLMKDLQELTSRGARLRVITTSYMGASDPEAVEWIARLPNTSMRVSYDVDRTRLHAKAYHFYRNSGFSTGYIGSSNMSHAAMTTGLEWNLKVTSDDMPHILEKFLAEFETYWNHADFVPYDPDKPQLLREAIACARSRTALTPVFFDIKPHAFQERILESLSIERTFHNSWRNLIVAATGTGKTVIAAFDFKRFFTERRQAARLLFVAHRKEILEQAINTFRGILRITDFGELLVGQHTASRYDHLFCSVDMLQSRRVCDQVGPEFYDYIVVDEVHHGPAATYRTIFDEFRPKVLLGLTATPERMDGQSVASDFGNRFAAEIRLPEALEEKLLCPFHYFGVADPIATNSDRFWKSGKYDIQALEDVYTGDHLSALQRVDTIVASLSRYEPQLERVRGIGFCVSVKHAEFMARKFNERRIASAVLVGDTPTQQRDMLLNQLRDGELTFLFTRDVLNEGLDVPEINTVLFLRPTESLTIFLQQLGRGLRRAPEKDYLTVLDFVGQVHRRYRIDRQLKALLPKQRFNIEREVESEFPHLPSGCSIQLDRVAREHVLSNIRQNLRNLKEQLPEMLQTFEHEAKQKLTFANFIRFHDYEPSMVLSQRTWSEWKAIARLNQIPNDPQLRQLRPALVSAAQTTGPYEIALLRKVVAHLERGDSEGAICEAGSSLMMVYYRLWGKAGHKLGFQDIRESFQHAVNNPSVIRDLAEVLDWAQTESELIPVPLSLPFPCPLELHATYGSDEIKAALGKADFDSAGETGVGRLHFKEIKTYVSLVTFQKTAKEFSPRTMYHDYPISRELMHWETQFQTSQKSETGQNLIHHEERGYTMLMFARSQKNVEGVTVPFTFLGPATLVSYESERPIKIVWRLKHPMPAEMFDENRRGA